MKKKKKEKYIDDGHTVYSMEGLNPNKIKKSGNESLNLTRKEKHAMIRAAYRAYLPVIIAFLLGFTIVFVILYFCLKQAS